ncbi:DUF928 domain-containing protein [Crocosphaera chwakensis]|uniref:DUF928 domain-containing protein n=1 Tax=Crocosphaera chwakensis CCY0110 TaxID=391612 RepID=A3IYL5_9CHRO|nr:DUF928 domain-containing protein [Crocosphaera chwakensis]EAZ88433.1 hypothetical protein CY0110_22981 [Crocosphaera chwakensis CCY0110]
MKKKITLIPFKKLSIFFYLIVLGVFSPLLSALSSPLQKDTTISLEFPNTGNRGAPKKSTGGGTRSEDETCLSNDENEPPLVALMPNRENKAKTASETLSFYGYIPTTTATEGEFVLVDEDNNEVYYTQFPLSSTPGIIKLEIPKTVALKPGNYTWSLMIICDSRYRNRDKYVEGSLEYVVLTEELENQIKDKPSLEKAQVYANESLWFETLDTVAKMKEENPQEWQELLTSVGLEMLAEVPIVDCCQPDN